MPPITCARQTLSAICIPTQLKSPRDVQGVLPQTREDERSRGAATRDAVRYIQSDFQFRDLRRPG